MQAAAELDRIDYDRVQAEQALKAAQQQIEMLQGKLDVLTAQIELSSTVIASYQAVEETRIAISTADRIRALAGPAEDEMP